jgi:transposase
LKERVQHSNRIKGLLFGQASLVMSRCVGTAASDWSDCKPGDGRPLPPHLKPQIDRELDRLEMVIEQIKAIEDELRHAIVAADTVTPRTT